MLPTTGHFKNFNCPFYETCICERPYCHFKHTKKEPANDTNLISELVSKAVHKVLNSNINTKADVQEKKEDTTQSVPASIPATSITYNPTPIAELNKFKTTKETPVPEKEKEKKGRHIPIQYTPEQPRSSRTTSTKLEYTVTDFSNASAGYSPTVSNYSTTTSVSYVPSSIKTLSGSSNSSDSTLSDEQKGQIYVPSTLNSNDSYTNLDSPKSAIKYSPTRNLNLIDNLTENEYVPKYNDEFIDEFLNDPNIYEPTEIPANKLEDKSDKTVEVKEKSDKTSEVKDKVNSSSKNSSSSQKSDDKSKKHSSSSSSSSKHSSSKHKHKESSISKHSSKEKQKSKESDQKNGCDKKHKSSSSDKHKSNKSSSDKHKSSSRDKHKSSSDKKTKSDKHSSEKTKHSDKVKTNDKNKTSDKSKSSDKDKDKEKSKPKVVEEIPQISNLSDDEVFMDMSDYESDEMEQCKRIFEEYQPPVENTQPEIKAVAKPVENEGGSVSALLKKRVAHDKSNTIIREKTVKHAPVKNAALVMTNRYKSIQAKLEQQTRENDKQLQQILETKKSLINETKAIKRSIENAQDLTNVLEEKTQDNSYHAPVKTKRIAHVPNVSLLLSAKKKMDEKAKVTTVNKTPVQTVSKGSKRVAHIPELTITDIPTPLQCEKSKLPVNVRSRYLFLMIKECVKLYVSKQAAYDRALNEELNCYSKCSTINTYRNSVMLSINRLRKEADSGISLNGSSSHLDNTSEFEGRKLYANLIRWILTEEELIENGFPRTGAAKKGHAIFKINKTIERVPEQCQLCVRCKKIYRVDNFGYPVFQEDCVYHPLNRFIFRGETRYICCKQPPSADGCCICNSHVFEVRDPSELTGFVSTFEPENDGDPRSEKVYALDCEMVYTTKGLELARVTVIDSKCDVVFESLVKPLGEIIDCNTRFSGLTTDMLKNVTNRITEVQATLLLIFNSKTILVGHSLESDLKALRIIHNTVVDTSVLFPHKMGPPRKRALRSLASDYLKKIIQNDEGGHDSAEDAITCMELLIWKLKEELKTR